MKYTKPLQQHTSQIQPSLQQDRTLGETLAAVRAPRAAALAEQFALELEHLKREYASDRGKFEADRCA